MSLKSMAEALPASRAPPGPSARAPLGRNLADPSRPAARPGHWSPEEPLEPAQALGGASLGPRAPRRRPPRGAHWRLAGGGCVGL